MEQRPKVVRDIVLTCVVLHNILRKHQEGQDRSLNLADDIAGIANEATVYVPDKTPQQSLEEGKNISEKY